MFDSRCHFNLECPSVFLSLSLSKRQLQGRVSWSWVFLPFFFFLICLLPCFWKFEFGESLRQGPVSAGAPIPPFCAFTDYVSILGWGKKIQIPLMLSP